jgi:hypothetical protein
MDEDWEHPVAGAVVAYFDLSHYPVGAVRRGVASGAAISDPGTDEQWIPVRRTGGTIDLVPAVLIIDVLPVED